MESRPQSFSPEIFADLQSPLVHLIIFLNLQYLHVSEKNCQKKSSLDFSHICICIKSQINSKYH